MEQVIVHMPITLSEVESNTQNQKNIESEGNDEVVEDNPINQNLLDDYQLARDRERRPHREPHKEPNTYEEAMKSEKSGEWLGAMREKIVKNKTWDIGPRPKDKSTIGSR